MEVSSDGGSGKVTVVTSTQFSVSSTERGEAIGDPRFVSADTAIVTPPFERIADIRQTRRIWVEVRPPPDIVSEGVPETVRLRVFVDDEERYDRAADVVTDTLRFSYVAAEL